MKTNRLFITSILFFACTVFSFSQEEDSRYIEVTGTSEITITPDEIHYTIEIKEYWEEEFKMHSKPEDYRTKVPLETIEKELRSTLQKIGISDKNIQTQEVGDYWREKGKDFLIGKRFDITLNNFNQVNEIAKNVDTRSINFMRIGELKNKDIEKYRQQGKIEALKAAKTKAAYLAETLDQQLGSVIRIIEPQDNTHGPLLAAQSNVYFSHNQSTEEFRSIKLQYSMLVRFELMPAATKK